MYKESKHLKDEDYEYMNSLSSAILQIRPKKLHIILWFWFFTIVFFLVWANFAKIDEITRGEGKVVSSGDNQIVQNLEGGIVDDILVKEGDVVTKNQVLIKITNKKIESTYNSNNLKSYALEAKITRLKAQLNNTPFVYDKNLNPTLLELYKNEESLYKSNLQQVKIKKDILNNQLQQKYNTIKDFQFQEKIAQDSLKMINKEIDTLVPMVKKGLSSNMDLFALKREKNALLQKYNSAKVSIPRLKSEVAELKNKISEVEYIFQSKSKEELSTTLSQLNGTDATAYSLKDQVQRTEVRSPMDGIIQKLFIHTVSGVVKPGEDLVEIVPLNSPLILEVKIKPSDIAFIYNGIEAMVKFSAFDFAIYGGLKGKVIQISPDTSTDQKGNQFYIVRIKTNKNSFEYHGKKMKIIPGMTVSVDILTGKKSILDYILKPIIKTKQYAFTQR